MAIKNVLLPVTIISAGDASGALTSSILDVRWLDNIGFQAVWTGTPTGTIAVQVSLDQTTWDTLVFSPVITQPAGSASHSYFQVQQTGTAYMRVIYTAGSGSGTLTVKACGKAI